MRSKLFVPGSRPELFAKALASEADGISIDLEDAVVEHRKAEARAIVRDWLHLNARAVSGKKLIVRVNAMDTPHFRDDIAAVVQPGLHVINLPKPDSIEGVRIASEVIAQAERDNGVQAPIGLLLNIETPWALRHAADLAGADPRVVGLQMGLGDLFEPLGIERSDQAAVHQVMLAVRLAAGEAGVYACDGAFANVAEPQAYRAEAMQARHLGFIGKSCIHPSQIALANEVFQPTAAEIGHALTVLAAATEAQRNGVGALIVEGRMVDAPFVLRAEAVVVEARRLGLLPAE